MLDLPEIPAFTQPLETDPQYELVVKLSEVSRCLFTAINFNFQLAIDIDQEIGVIHKVSKN
jgi:hypothetical protein